MKTLTLTSLAFSMTLLVNTGAWAESTTPNTNVPTSATPTRPASNNNSDAHKTAAAARRALALSKRPAIVGVEKLALEAEGLRQLTPAAIYNWRLSRLIPDI